VILCWTRLCKFGFSEVVNARLGCLVKLCWVCEIYMGCFDISLCQIKGSAKVLKVHNKMETSI